MAEQIVLDLGQKTKVCGDCKQSKPVSEFNKHYGKPRSTCKKCHSASSSAWNVRNKEHRDSYVKEWHANNQERVRGHKKKYAQNLSPEQIENRKKQIYWWQIKKSYGLTPEDWQSLSDAQGGLCAICKIPGRTGRGGKLSVDHCHTTGRIRGLLCNPCNTALGILGDTTEQWELVWKYLKGAHHDDQGISASPRG